MFRVRVVPTGRLLVVLDRGQACCAVGIVSHVLSWMLVCAWFLDTRWGWAPDMIKRCVVGIVSLL